MEQCDSVDVAYSEATVSDYDREATVSDYAFKVVQAHRLNCTHKHNTIQSL